MTTYRAAALLLSLLLLAPAAQAQVLSGPPGAVNANGGTAWRGLAARAGDYNSALDYGVAADGYTAADGTIAAASNSFASASKNCAAADVGKVLTVSGAGAVDGNGAQDPLVTTVTGCSGNAFLLAAAASTAQANVPWAYGTDNSTALAAALAASPRGIVRLPPGGILVNTGGVVLNNHALECVKAPNFDTNSFASNGQGQYGTTLLLTSLATPPFYLGNSMRVAGCNFYWPGQTGISRQGTAAPAYPAQPTLAASGGGSLAAGTYWAEITYLQSGVESPRSIETSIAVSASGTLTATLPSLLSTGADHWNLYVGATSGSEELQNASPIAIGTTSDAITALTTGTAAPPAPFVPVAFPPLFESKSSTGGFVNDVVADNTVINAYDALVECNGAADPVPSCAGADGGGNVRFTGNNIYAVHRVFSLSSISETMAVENSISNPSIFSQPPSLGGIAGNLVGWTTENGEWLYVEGNGSAGGACSSRVVGGLLAAGDTVEDYRYGIHVGTGLFSEATISRSTISAETPLQIDAAGGATNDSIDARWVAIRGNGSTAAPNAAAFAFNSTCTGFPGAQESLNLSGVSEQNEGTLIDIEGTGQVWVNAAHLSAFQVGNSSTAGAYYVAKLNNASATLNLNGLVANTYVSGVGGIDAAAGTLDLGQYSIGTSATPLTLGAATLHAMPVSNISFATPTDPAGTSTGWKMMGLCVFITPKSTGNIWITINGTLVNSTAGDGGNVQLNAGTGSCPANGAAQTGSNVGGYQDATNIGTTQTPFSVTGIASGLTVGTRYWIDLSVTQVTGGTASVHDVQISAHEM